MSGDGVPVGLEALLREYRPSMDVDVLHAWAKDVVAALAQQPAAVDEARAMKLWDEFREAGNHEHDALTFVLRALAAQQGGDT